MNYRSRHFVLLLVFILTVFTQCQKPASPLDQTATEPSKVTIDKLPGACPYPCTDVRCEAYQTGYCGTPPPPPTITVIKNTSNPYDNVGNEHNNAVASIYPTVSASDPNLDNDVLAQVGTYTSGLGYSVTSLDSFYNVAVGDGLLPFSQIEELDSLGYVMVQLGLIGTQANSYVQQIYNYTTTYLGGTTVTSAQYSSFANSLISLESQISSDGIITASEKVTLLSICAIGRYSAAYWINFENSQGTAAAAKFQVTPAFNLKKWFHNLSFFWKVTLSDVGGGLIGTIGGPVGIIGGAIGTSIVSGIQLAN